jgi:RNA polymerase sigma factor (sigma-70 family)
MEISLPSHDFKDQNLISLLDELLNSDDETEQRHLQTELYKQLQEGFFDRCTKIAYKLYKGFPDIEERRDDIFQETFITAFEVIKTFTIDPEWDELKYQKKFLNWLGTIANNKILKGHNKDKKDKNGLERYVRHYKSEISNRSIGKRTYKPTYDKVRFAEVWESLNPMSKEIIMLGVEYNAVSEEVIKHLPDKELEALTKKYGVGKPAIRKAKERALKLIRSCKIEN